MLSERATAKPVRKTKVAMSHDDEELPPERAAELAKREAELKKLLASGTLIETFRTKPR